MTLFSDEVGPTMVGSNAGENCLIVPSMMAKGRTKI